MPPVRTKPLSKFIPAYARTKMSSHTAPPRSLSGGPSSDVQEFTDVLKSSTRILALCGAGLSAASGLDTFRGAGGMWRNHDAKSLATPQAFERDPGLVWLFYSYRRHKALQAKPNAGHYALAELGRRMKGFVCLTQNVDGLSQRAQHPREQLKLLHGSLYDIKCANCDRVEQDNFSDPFHPLLAISSAADPRLAPSANTSDPETRTPYSDPSITINPADLPHCLACKVGLLRPGVVWFGEPLPEDTLQEVEDWLAKGKVDLMLVIGTTATVWPAAGYVQEARVRGARIAVVNMDGLGNLGSADDLGGGDFLFEGDASAILPEILRGVVGDLGGVEK